MLIARREIEYPMLMTGPLVCQTLAGKKTVTRRLNRKWLRAKKGQHIWVRETCKCHPNFNAALYAADNRPVLIPQPTGLPTAWWYSKRVCPSIHMPRRVCRILLRVTEDARLEPLQDITEEESEAEGVVLYYDNPNRVDRRKPKYREGFITLWDSIHGDKPKGCWKANPEVARVPFEIEEVVR